MNVEWENVQVDSGSTLVHGDGTAAAAPSVYARMKMNIESSTAKMRVNDGERFAFASPFNTVPVDVCPNDPVLVVITVPVDEIVLPVRLVTPVPVVDSRYE